MKRIKRNSHLLTSFHKLNKRQQENVKKNLDNDQIKFISELCLNLLNKNISLSDEIKKKLSPLKCKIRKMACKFRSLKQKKAILQKGGFLPALLGFLGRSALTALLSSLAHKVGENF